VQRSARALGSLYVGGVVAAGVALLALSLRQVGGHQATGPAPVAFWLLATLLVVGEMRPLRWLDRRIGGETTVTWSFAGALLLLVPLGIALSALVVASALGDLAARKSAQRLAFNASQLALSLAAGAAVLDLAGARFAIVDGTVRWWWLPLGFAAAAAILVVNALLVSGVIAIHQQVLWRLVLRPSLLENASTDGMLLALAPIYVVVADRAGVLLPALLITALAVYSSARAATARQFDATHDHLTGLPNRRILREQLALATASADLEHGAALMLVDLDGFKEINDRLGHRVGDVVLQEVASRLVEGTRPSDTVARLGGDEFAVLVRPLDRGVNPDDVAERLAALLSKPCDVEGFPVVLGCSIGLAITPDHGDDPDTLLERADVAMYAAKREHSRVERYQPAGDQGPGKIGLLADLSRALDRNELELAFQPIIRVADGDVSGVEALVRWHHPTWGPIAPMSFMPLAEQTELMTALTEHVLDGSLAQAARWRSRGLDLLLAVNSSARNLVDLRFPDMVAAALARSGVPASSLEIEITENAVLTDPARVHVVLGALRDLGVRIAIDDFGTGYSSLVHLRDLPVDRVKIDRSFVRDLFRPRDRGIVGPIVTLAHNLGVEVVAEGVEDLRTLDVLADLGCDHAQGFAIAAPSAPDSTMSWLLARAELRAGAHA
jgi:diguanylate cyclase (GGDEF)-like protein